MSIYFQNLPDGMTAEMDSEAKICYIRNTPHTLIDCLEMYVSSWRDVLYLNMEDFHEKAKKDSRHLTQPLFYLMVQADQAGCETLAFYPALIPSGVMVYRDAEGNIRPSTGYDPVNVSVINRRVMGISGGMDAEGNTIMGSRGIFTANVSFSVGSTIYTSASFEDQP